MAWCCRKLQLPTAKPSNPCMVRSSVTKTKRARLRFPEKIIWPEPHRGATQPTEKEAADSITIGGLRNAADSVSRLHLVSTVGRSLGAKLKTLLSGNPDWINQTCDAIGATDGSQPPPDVTAAVVDAQLLKAWQRAAGDPVDQVGIRRRGVRTKSIQTRSVQSRIRRVRNEVVFDALKLTNSEVVKTRWANEVE